MSNQGLIQIAVTAVAIGLLGLAGVLPGHAPEGWGGIVLAGTLLGSAILGIWWLVLEKRRRARAKEVVDESKSKGIKMGDKYTNNGNNFGNMGPTYYGKVPFQLTNAIAQEVLAALPKDHPINVTWIGSSRSAQIAESLVGLMTNAGFTIGERDSCGIHMPPMERALTYNEDNRTLYIDADK